MHLILFLLLIKEQAVITEKYGAHGCNVSEDGGFAPNISRQVLFSYLKFRSSYILFESLALLNSL